MNHSIRIHRGLLVFVWFMAPIGHAQSTVSSDLAKQFKTEWTSVHYQKSVSVNNPDIQENQRRPTERNESLSLACHIHILKPDLILGICSTPKILEMTPPGVTEKTVSRRSRMSMRYQPLRYEPGFQRPDPPSKIQTTIRSLLHLPQDPPPRPELITTLKPSSIQIDLNIEALDSPIKEIDAIKGIFHVLTAETIEEVDIPFEPNANWIPLTKDLEIYIQEAESTASSYRYRIDTRHPGGGRGRGLSRQDFSVGSMLPERILVGQQFIGEDGEPIHRHRSHSLPVHVGGNGSGSGGKGPVTKIRYRIGVNPQHREVPFTLKSIPLPQP